LGVFPLPGQVIFDCRNLETPPDFLFGEDEAMFTTYDSVASLSKWNIENPKCLRNTLIELIELYSQHHKANILTLNNERLLFEHERVEKLAIKVSDPSLLSLLLLLLLSLFLHLSSCF